VAGSARSVFQEASSAQRAGTLVVASAELDCVRALVPQAAQQRCERPFAHDRFRHALHAIGQMMRAQAAYEERPVIGEDMMRMTISGIIITQNPVLASECRAPPAVEEQQV